MKREKVVKNMSKKTHCCCTDSLEPLRVLLVVPLSLLQAVLAGQRQPNSPRQSALAPEPAGHTLRAQGRSREGFTYLVHNLTLECLDMDENGMCLLHKDRTNIVYDKLIHSALNCCCSGSANIEWA